MGWHPIESANIVQPLLHRGCVSLRDLIVAPELESLYLVVSIAGFVSIVNLSQSSHLSSLVDSLIHKDIDRKVVA